MESRTGLAAQPHPQRDGGASKSGRDKVSHQVRMYLHSAGANGTRPECGTSREYRKLASEGLTGDTANAGSFPGVAAAGPFAPSANYIAS